MILKRSVERPGVYFWEYPAINMRRNKKVRLKNYGKFRLASPFFAGAEAPVPVC